MSRLKALRSEVKSIYYNLRLFLFKTVVRILQQGPMPKHVGMILDGNRRFAKKQKFSKVIDGHEAGKKNFYKILDAIEILGVPEITLYAFSNENFNRAQEEVQDMMALLEKFGHKICANVDAWKEKDIGFQVIGNYKTAGTQTIRHLADKIMWTTKSHKTCVLNIAFAYTGQSEIVNCAKTLLDGLFEDELTIDDLNDELFEETLSLRRMRPVDMLIRTGGDERFSDFLLWQSSNAYLEFFGVTWPEFTGLHFISSIFRYQMQMVFKGLNWQRKSQEASPLNGGIKCADGSERKAAFVAKRKEAQWTQVGLEASRRII